MTTAPSEAFPLVLGVDTFGLTNIELYGTQVIPRVRELVA